MWLQNPQSIGRQSTRSTAQQERNGACVQLANLGLECVQEITVPVGDVLVVFSGSMASTVPSSVTSAIASPPTSRTSPPWSGTAVVVLSEACATTHSLPGLAKAMSSRTNKMWSPGTMVPPVNLTS